MQGKTWDRLLTNYCLCCQSCKKKIAKLLFFALKIVGQFCHFVELITYPIDLHVFSHHFDWSDPIKWPSKQKKRFGKVFQWLILSWVWCRPIYWVIKRGFVCTVCAQVIQSWGKGFHRGPSLGHCCLIYSLMTWIMWSRTCLWD